GWGRAAGGLLWGSTGGCWAGGCIGSTDSGGVGRGASVTPGSFSGSGGLWAGPDGTSSRTNEAVADAGVNSAEDTSTGGVGASGGGAGVGRTGVSGRTSRAGISGSRATTGCRDARDAGVSSGVSCTAVASPFVDRGRMNESRQALSSKPPLGGRARKP